MQLFLQLSKLQGTTSYFDENVGRVGVKSDTVAWKETNLPIVHSSEVFFVKEIYPCRIYDVQSHSPKRFDRD